MNVMSETQATAPTARISAFLLTVVFITLALSFAALIFAVYIMEQNAEVEAAWILILLGFLGVAISTYVLFQMRRRISKMKIVVPPVTTTVECKKCGVKTVREFQRGDFIFKEGEKCQKCDEKMLITAIYREVKEKEKSKMPF
jgi:hypothetical protein